MAAFHAGIAAIAGLRAATVAARAEATAVVRADLAGAAEDSTAAAADSVAAVVDSTAEAADSVAAAVDSTEAVVVGSTAVVVVIAKLKLLHNLKLQQQPASCRLLLFCRVRAVGGARDENNRERQPSSLPEKMEGRKLWTPHDPFSERGTRRPRAMEPWHGWCCLLLPFCLSTDSPPNSRLASLQVRRRTH